MATQLPAEAAAQVLSSAVGGWLLARQGWARTGCSGAGQSEVHCTEMGHGGSKPEEPC